MKRLTFAATALVALAAGAVAVGPQTGPRPAGAGLAVSPWPKCAGDAANSGRGAGPTAAGVLRWRVKAGGAVIGGAAIGSDGTVFVGAHDGTLYALQGATGEKRWEFGAGAPIEAAPLVTHDGGVVVAAFDGAVTCVDGSSGEARWRREIGEAVQGVREASTYGAASAPDGLLLISSGSAAGRLSALDARTGEVRWSSQNSGACFGCPAIGRSPTTAYCWSRFPAASRPRPGEAEAGWALSALDLRAHAPRWHRSAPRPVGVASVVATADGGIACAGEAPGRDGATVLMLNAASGTVRWRRALPALWPLGGCAVGVSGALYVAANPYSSEEAYRAELSAYGGVSAPPQTDETVPLARGPTCLALDGRTGTTIWEAAIPDRVWSPPSITRDGDVYLGCRSGAYAISGRTGAVLWRCPTNAPVTSQPAIALDGTVYFGSRDGWVYAVR